MRQAYRTAMEWLYIACIAMAGVAMVVITAIIPYGVFMRYVVNSPASWPEPAGILMMILFSFVGGAAAYRANAHIAVGTLLNMVNAQNRRRLEFVGDVGMGVVGIFMTKWGIQLVQAVWHNTIAEFPDVSVGVTYTPIPIAGVITLLFCIERLWLGQPSADSFTFRDQPQID
ncbi:MAG: TRAP transporter small permease [Betaproteobacteria bacterium]|nr:TRAP transporter small permease [Betaproteobacteria bacterium]